MEILFAIAGGWLLVACLFWALLLGACRLSTRAERVCQRLLLEQGYKPFDWAELEERDVA